MFKDITIFGIILYDIFIYFSAVLVSLWNIIQTKEKAKFPSKASQYLINRTKNEEKKIHIKNELPQIVWTVQKRIPW